MNDMWYKLRFVFFFIHILAYILSLDKQNCTLNDGIGWNTTPTHGANMYIDKSSSASLQRSLSRVPDISRGRPAFIGFDGALKPLPWQLIPKTYTVKSSILPAKDMKISGAFGNQCKHLPDDNRITTLSLFSSLCLSIPCFHTRAGTINIKNVWGMSIVCWVKPAVHSDAWLIVFLLLIQMCWIADSLIAENAIRLTCSDLIQSSSQILCHIINQYTNHFRKLIIFKWLISKTILCATLLKKCWWVFSSSKWNNWNKNDKTYICCIFWQNVKMKTCHL